MSRVRFWCVYAAAWLPYAASYYVLFRLLPWFAEALRQTCYNILPAAALGAAIVPWTRVLRWEFHRRWWFYPAQLGSAVSYSLLWYFGVLVLGSLGKGLQTHHFVLGYFSYYAMQWQAFSGLMIYGNVAGVMYVMQANERLRHEEQRRVLAEGLQTRAELGALRAQLNPHFLFNTLNSIMALAGPDQPRTTQAIAELAAMLRYTLNQSGESDGVSLRQELEFTDQYLALEQLRFGDRLMILREISAEAMRFRLPPLTLQPLVENAIRHGIAPRVGRSKLVLRAYVRDAALHVAVEDDGLGFDSGVVTEASGLGLKTVKQRLELFSRGQSRFDVWAEKEMGCRVSITLPQGEGE